MYTVNYNSALNSWIYLEFNFLKNYERGKVMYVLDCKVKTMFLNKCNKGCPRKPLSSWQTGLVFHSN